MDIMHLQLKTRRLILRVPQQQDFDGFAELFGDEEAARFVGGPLKRAEAWRKFLQMPGAWLVQGFGMFSVIDRKSGEWLGQIGPWRPEGWPGPEVGWSFRRATWGKGYATEAGEAAMGFAFEQLGWKEVIHSIDPGNVASQKLAERLGSRNRGPGQLPAPYEDHPVEIWGQSRDEWRERRASQTSS